MKKSPSTLPDLATLTGRSQSPKYRGGEDMIKCSVCKWGFGLWGIGEPAPMGPCDAEDGCPTVKCPKCGGNKNPRSIEEERP